MLAVYLQKCIELCAKDSFLYFKDISLGFKGLFCFLIVSKVAIIKIEKT